MKTIIITLTIAGADTGPFDLYSNVDSYTSPFETNIPKSSLIAGYTSYLVPDLTTIIRVKSVGVCTNYSDFPIVDPCALPSGSAVIGIPTPTPTPTLPPPTPTPTLPPPTPTPTLPPPTPTPTPTPPSLTYIVETNCGDSCLKKSGNMSVNGIQQFVWTNSTVLPQIGTLTANIGDTILINATGFSTGSGCIDIIGEIRIFINNVLVAFAQDDTISWSFVYNETTEIRVTSSCAIP